MQILRTLVAVASGRHHRSRKGRRHRHGTSAPHGHSHERRESAGRQAWLVNQEISFWHLGIFVCVLLVMILLGWRIIAQTTAQSLAGSDPGTALNWVGDQPTALNQLAQQELLDPDGNLDAAREWSQRALRSYPLGARALTLLGLIAERKGDQTSADALMRISGARTWRNQTAQRWLFNRDVGRGDYASALPHLDAILRMDYESRKDFFPVLAALMTADPRAFRPLTALLATSPPWRASFLTEMSARLVNPGRLVQLYAALKETDNPPTNEELRPYLNRLIKDGDFEQAHQTWQGTLLPQQRTNDTFPFNRDFDLPIDGLPFNWDLEVTPGADIQIVSLVNGGKKRALLVQFSGARVDFAVKQLMLMPAGEYTFRGRVKAEALRTSRGLWWQIACASNPAKALANTELVSGTMPWTDFTVNFQVPPRGCRAQWLQLELPARIGPEREIEGQVWYQYLRIAPASAAAVMPSEN
jgi:tetratricopeptide (TPR) repeat protein